MDKLSFDNPLFATYVIAATLLILKAAAMSWLVVFRMIRENGGFRSPEDLKKLSPIPIRTRASSSPIRASSGRAGSNSMTSRAFPISWWPDSSGS